MPAHAFLCNGVTAHRGNSAEFPENTMPAFQSALALGADWIELDVHETRDGRLVVIHDFDTRRVGGQALAVADSTYDELKRVDVAAVFRETNGLSLADCPKGEIPLLSDVLALTLAQDRTRLSMQPKSDCVDACIEMVREMGAEAWVGFNDGDLAKMARVKELAPRIPVFWDRGPATHIGEDIRIALYFGFETIVVNREGVTQAKVAAIHAAGLEAGAWTVNGADEMAAFLALGVDRLYTDCPRLMLEAKARQSP